MRAVCPTFLVFFYVICRLTDRPLTNRGRGMPRGRPRGIPGPLLWAGSVAHAVARLAPAPAGVGRGLAVGPAEVLADVDVVAVGDGVAGRRAGAVGPQTLAGPGGGPDPAVPDDLLDAEALGQGVLVALGVSAKERRHDRVPGRLVLGVVDRQVVVVRAAPGVQAQAAAPVDGAAVVDAPVLAARPPVLDVVGQPERAG